MALKPLDRLRTYLEGIDEHVIEKDDDLVLPVVGNEGAGKSTLMVAAVWLWADIRGGDPTPDSVLDAMVWGERDAFKEAMLESDVGSAIAVQDAPHVLYSKEAMHGEQIDVEKALLDIRIDNFLILLGFQDWSDIPDGLRRRRAQNAIRVVKKGGERGYYELYGRDELDEKYSDLDKNEWPDATTEGRFPSLEGTEVWDEFNRRDREAKESRLQDSQEVEVDDARKQEQIKTALRAVEPWDDSKGMTQRDASKLIDYSETWVSRRVQEWREGAYRDLAQKDDTVNRVAARGS